MCSPAEQWAKVLPDGLDGKICDTSYDGDVKMCDGCGGDFEQHPIAVRAGLTKAELVAARLYSGVRCPSCRVLAIVGES